MVSHIRIYRINNIVNIFLNWHVMFLGAIQSETGHFIWLLRQN